MEENGQKTKRLYKSRRNKIIDGVCGGFAEYFDVDPSIIRLLWVLVTLMGGAGFIAYLVAMIIMPVNPEHTSVSQVVSPAQVNDKSDKRRFFGVLLILIGTLILLVNFGWFWDFGWWSFTRSILLPLLIIGLGAFLIYLQTSRKKGTTSKPGTGVQDIPPIEQVRRELRRSKENRKLFGVCSGIGKYFDIDPTIVRFTFIFIALVSFGWGLLIYIILGIVMPEEKSSLTISKGESNV
jgi:phage shock protein C